MSDDEMQIDRKSHKQLLEGISNLGKSQHIRNPIRNEVKLLQDEFQLDKGAVAKARAKRHLVDVNDIVHVLKKTKKHLDVGKQLKSAVIKKKVLEKPLEKPAAERIKRSIGYESVKKKLARWNAVVTSNRSAESQVFPLKSETVYVNTFVHSKPLKQAVKNDLILQIEELENKYNKIKREQLGDTQSPQELEQRERELLINKLSRDELIAKRRDLAYLKLRESQKSAKSRMQNKIKSKKYHKLLKKQKLQDQIKQFELLQKTNPEAAMEKLNQLEKSRILERANLRHKNTGSWAKNLQIRAKYDKDVRTELAEQLQISRQLTQKVTDHDSDQEMHGQMVKPDEADEVDNDPFNPWTKLASSEKGATGMKEEDSNWRKYWADRNANEKKLNEYKLLLSDRNEARDSDTSDDVNNKLKDLESSPKIEGNKQKKQNKKMNKKKIEIENGWLIEELDSGSPQSIDAIFDEKEETIKENLRKKLEIISQRGNQISKNKKHNKKPELQVNQLKSLEDLSFKTAASRPIIDEELKNELDGRSHADDISVISGITDNLLGPKASGHGAAEIGESVACSIDPKKIAPVQLQQGLADFASANEVLHDVDFNDDDDNIRADQQMTIAQAFEDDDIVSDFSRDKSKDSELKNTEVQLSMPGWGSWAGAGISREQMEKRNKRLLLKLVPHEKRKDENKDGVYINENSSKKLKNHLVSDIPFPFTSLESYEASIRSPIGRTFVTETSFRMLTRPNVITHKGKVIEPMDESVLIKKARKLRNPIDVRISNMAEK